MLLENVDLRRFQKIVVVPSPEGKLLYEKDGLPSACRNKETNLSEVQALFEP